MRRRGPAGGTPAGGSRGKDPAPAGQPCGSLARILARIFRETRPEVLDLGPLCGQTVTYLAQRGAVVHVEPFEPPPPLPAADKDEPSPALPPVRIDQPDGKFHLVLAWEHLDFVPPERVGDFAREVARVLREGGWLFVFSRQTPPEGPERPPRYRLLADDRIVREATDLPARPRWAMSTRDLERGLEGFSVQGIHLQRSQVREISAVKT